MLKKYQFNSKEDFEALDLKTHHKPVLVPSKVLEDALLDENYNVIKEAVIEDNYCVDIYWHESEDFSLLDMYEVFPKESKHEIA